MDRIGRFECLKKHFTQRFRMSVAPNPSSPGPRYTPLLPHPSVGGRSRRGWQGRRRGRRSCILRSRSGRGAFSSPASRRGGYVYTVHRAGTQLLTNLSRDVPDRWNWAGSRSLICIHGTRSRRALPAGWRQHFFCFSSAFYCLSILQGRHYNIICLRHLAWILVNKTIIYKIILERKCHS